MRVARRRRGLGVAGKLSDDRKSKARARANRREDVPKIVRAGADGERELVMARRGMPGPPQYGGPPVTNIRNASSPHWRGWLGKRNRCLVPATSFCEYADTKPRKTPIWFALDEDRPLFAFAGLWASWRGVRGPKSAPVDCRAAFFDPAAWRDSYFEAKKLYSPAPVCSNNPPM